MSSFGENLKALRMSRYLTQERFAKLAGTNQANVTAWERGTRMPNLQTIQGIADTFKVPLSSLISIKDTGYEDDYVREVADVLQHDPKIRLLFDRAKLMSPSDLDAVLAVVNAISKERSDD